MIQNNEFNRYYFLSWFYGLIKNSYVPVLWTIDVYFVLRIFCMVLCEIFWKKMKMYAVDQRPLAICSFFLPLHFFSRFQGNCLDYFLFFNFPSPALPALVGTSELKNNWGSSYLVYIPGICKEQRRENQFSWQSCPGLPLPHNL